MKKKCEKCNDHAIYQITDILDKDHYVELHLCSVHAQQHIVDPDHSLGAESSTTEASEVLVKATSSSDAKCPICGLSFNEFRQTGRLGCPNDYQVFRVELRPLIEGIHGELQHSGKTPRRLPVDAQLHTRIIRLRQQLQQAVAVENYEEAAQLRDQIDSLEKQQSSPASS